MERLGDNLADIRKRMQKGVFSMATTLRLGIQMIDSLEGTHNLGYIHRDVKPANVFITNDGDVKLGDFGISGSQPRSLESGSGAIDFAYQEDALGAMEQGARVSRAAFRDQRT